MPETIAAAVAFVSETGIQIGALEITTTQILTAVAATYTLRDQQRKAQNRARDAYNASVKDRYVMTRAANDPRQFVLGRQRVSGPIAFIRSTGADRTTLAFLVLLAAHECDAIETIYVDDEIATLDGAGNVVAVQRRDQYAISTSTMTVDLASTPASGTVTAVAQYGTSTVPLTVTSVSGTTVSVSGASAGSTGTLVITYQPATNPWTATATGTDLSATLTLDSSGNGSTTLAGAPLSGWFAIAVTGSDNTTSVSAQTSISGTTATITGGPAGAPVTITYRTLESGASTSRMKITKYLGAPGQVADAGLISLFPGIWTSAHVLTGQTYLKVECTFDPDAFPSGLPNISAMVRGAKLYDPRTGLTAWSENPALMCCYVATHPLLGRQLASAMNDTNIAAQANVCDRSVTYLLDGQSYTRPLYTAGHVIKTGTRPADVLNDLCGAMAGKWCVVDGMLRLRAGAAVTPLQALDDTWLAGEIDSQSTSIEIQAQVARADAFNTATGKFADASRDYQETDFAQVTADAYVAADGATLPLEISLPAVTCAAQAQQVVATMMRDARMGLRVTLTCNMRAFAVEPFDVLSVTLDRFGWVGKLFEVLDVQWTVGGGIQLTLKETAPGIWALGAAFSSVPLAPPTLLPSPWYVPAVAGLACASGTSELQTQADGTVVSTLRVSWAPITDRYVTESGGGIEVRYGLATDPESAWRTVRAPEGTSSLRLHDVHDGRLYLVKARAYTAMTKGAWCALLLHLVVGKTAPPSNVAGAGVGVSKGRAVWVWSVPADADWDVIEIRAADSHWGDLAVPALFRGRASQWAEVLTAAGDLTRYMRHIDTSGNPSASTTSVTAHVAAADLVQDGAPGNAGANGATVYLFQRTTSATPPVVPSGVVTYTFATGVAAGIGVWTQTLGDSGGSYRWLISALASSTGSTDTIATGEWGAPALLSDATGALAGLDQVDSGQIVPGAAAKVTTGLAYIDSGDGAGAPFVATSTSTVFDSVGDVYKIKLTPAVDCQIELTVMFEAGSVGGTDWFGNSNSRLFCRQGGATTYGNNTPMAAARSAIALHEVFTVTAAGGSVELGIGYRLSQLAATNYWNVAIKAVEIRR